MAKVKLYSVIGDFGATTADISAMLEQNKNEAVLDLYIMSPGGSVFDGIAIYNELKQFSGELNVYVNGIAASAASIIAMAGKTITMMEGSLLMIHRAIAMTYGNVEEHLKMAETLEIIDKQINAIYAEKTGMDAAKIKSLMDAETWIDGAEAVEMGFANKCGGKPDEEEEEEEQKAHITDSWANILNIYKNTPKTIVKNYFKKPETSKRKEKSAMDEKTKAEIADIEAKCVGATADFVLAQYKEGASIEEAILAWKDAQIETLKAENATLKAAIEAKVQENAQIRNAIVAPSGSGVPTQPKAESSPATDPIQEWNTAVNAAVDERKIKKQAAIKILVKEMPELHAAYIEAYNALNTRK